MHSIIKTSFAAIVAAGITASTAHAEAHALSGDLFIFSDMSNPAPRAVMEGMVERFGAMHSNLNIELTIIDLSLIHI